MRRFIDVVFVQPKNRYYVVLHEGKFWQLPRMNLTSSSWVFKLLYKGSLNEIFVAKDQAVACERLSRTLKTYELPKELHGLSANRFLDWWDMNDYKWLSTKDVIALGDTQEDEPEPVSKTVIAPQALEILQKKLTNGTEPPKKINTEPSISEPIFDTIQEQPQNEEIPLKSTTSTQRTPLGQSKAFSKLQEFNAQYAKKTPEPTLESFEAKPQIKRASPSNITPPTASPSTQTQAVVQSIPTIQSTPAPQPTVVATKAVDVTSRTSALDESFDIFDDLLKELNEELIHH